MKKEIVKEEKTEKVEKVKKEKVEKKEQKALVTSRVLFISVLDKIYLVIICLCFLIGTYLIFQGEITSLNYGFWSRVGKEILFLIILFILYLFMNWIYRCAAKTMLCLTKNQVYKEHYVPFKRSETSIPLNKITGVSTINIFWIFRAIIIHQYHKLPMIFLTWNNQEFKDKLNELITTENEKVENEYESKNIISEGMYKYLAYVGIGLAGIICLLGIIRFFTFTFSSERKIAGTYTYQDNMLVLDKNGSCEIEGLVDRVTECKWHYDSDAKEVRVDYEYKYSYYYSYYTNTGTLILKYNTSDKSLEYNNMKFTK